MESLKQAARRIDALLCTTAAAAPMELDDWFSEGFGPRDLRAGGPLDAPDYLHRGSSKPGSLSPNVIIRRPE